MRFFESLVEFLFEVGGAGVLDDGAHIGRERDDRAMFASFKIWIVQKRGIIVAGIRK